MPQPFLFCVFGFYGFEEIVFLDEC